MEQLGGYSGTGVKGNVLEWGPCVQCGETQVQIVHHRISDDDFDGDYPTPRCLNPECADPRPHLPLTRHAVVSMSINIIEITDEIDLSHLKQFCECCKQADPEL